MKDKHENQMDVMSRRAILKSLTALAGGFALHAAYVRTSRKRYKTLQTVGQG